MSASGPSDPLVLLGAARPFGFLVVKGLFSIDKTRFS